MLIICCGIVYVFCNSRLCCTVGELKPNVTVDCTDLSALMGRGNAVGLKREADLQCLLVPHESELSRSFLVNSRCYTLSSLELLRCHLLLPLMCFSLINPSSKWFLFPTSSFFLVIGALFLPLLPTLRFHSSLFNKRCLIDNWKSTYLHTYIHTRAQDSNKEAPYLSYQRHFVHVPACRWIIYGDTSAYTDTQYPIGGDADMGCCILCVFTVCVCVYSADCCHCGGMKSLQGHGAEWECCHDWGPAAFLLSLCCMCCCVDHKRCMLSVSVWCVNWGWMILFLCERVLRCSRATCVIEVWTHQWIWQVFVL